MIDTAAENQRTSSKPTRRRYQMLALIFVSVIINYMDRINVSVAASQLSSDLSLTSKQIGYLFSAWALTYSFLQIPGGVVVDVIKARVLYPILFIAWSVATLIQGLISSLLGLIGCRIAVGLFEAPSYPCNNKIVTAWFPANERAGAIAVYTSGQFVGMAFLMPLLTTVQNYFGWRGLFISSGIVGILWAGLWYLLYRDPDEDQKVNEAELQHIRQDAAADEGAEPAENEKEEAAKFEWKNLAFVLKQRKLWGIFIGQFCLGSTQIFFLTWFLTYLVDYRNMGFIKSGYMASVPFLAGFLGILMSGFTSDYLVRRGVSKEVSRKAPVILGLFLSMGILGANYTENNTLIVAFLALAFFGSGLASIAWIFVSLLSPKKLLGLVGGCFNFFGGLSAIVIPTAIGYIVSDGDFRPALAFIAALAFIGMCSYLFLVGKITRLEYSGPKADV